MVASAEFLHEPRWPKAAPRRLSVSLAAASVVVLGLLLLLDWPQVVQRLPIEDLVVQLIRPPAPDLPAARAAIPEAVSEVAPIPQELTPAAPNATNPSDRPAAGAASAAELQGFIDQSVRDYVNRDVTTYSINPNMDRRRAAAEKQFAAIPDHSQRPVWENVETDTMGRKVLHAGDCYRVINDPNVGSREAFETFGQYIVSCPTYDEPPKNLAWVEEVNKRREVLSRYGHQPAE